MMRSKRASEYDDTPGAGCLEICTSGTARGKTRKGLPISTEWLEVIDSEAGKALIEHRRREAKIKLTYNQQTQIQEWAGNHPYLLQQLLNALSEAQREDSREEIETIFQGVMRQEQDIFNGWWKSFSEEEQDVYKIISQERQISISALQEKLNRSENTIIDVLEVLSCTGVIKNIRTSKVCMLQ